jgi:hypothetical protein
VNAWRTCALAALLVLAQGCAMQNPEWAESINPCCGQDEVAAGLTPSEDRCADMVMSQEAALRLAWQVAAGSGMTEWRVRLIPGGPACIWRKWPGVTDDDFRRVSAAVEAEEPLTGRAPADSGAVVPAPPDQDVGRGRDGAAPAGP